MGEKGRIDYSGTSLRTMYMNTVQQLVALTTEATRSHQGAEEGSHLEVVFDPASAQATYSSNKQ